MSFFLNLYNLYNLFNYLLFMYLTGDVAFHVIRFNQSHSTVFLIKILLSPSTICYFFGDGIGTRELIYVNNNCCNFNNIMIDVILVINYFLNFVLYTILL